MTFIHCVKSVRILSYSGPHFPAFGLNTERYSVLRISPYSVRMRENAHQNNSEYGHFLRSGKFSFCLRLATFFKKETLAQVFPCEFREISKKTFSYRTPPVAASVDLYEISIFELDGPSSLFSETWKGKT